MKAVWAGGFKNAWEVYKKGVRSFKGRIKDKSLLFCQERWKIGSIKLLKNEEMEGNLGKMQLILSCLVEHSESWYYDKGIFLANMDINFKMQIFLTLKSIQI